MKKWRSPRRKELGIPKKRNRGRQLLINAIVVSLTLLINSGLSQAQPLQYDENIAGDLSNASPPLNLDAGQNNVAGFWWFESYEEPGGPGDFPIYWSEFDSDNFTIVVPQNQALVAVSLAWTHATDGYDGIMQKKSFNLQSTAGIGGSVIASKEFNLEYGNSDIFIIPQLDAGTYYIQEAAGSWRGNRSKTDYVWTFELISTGPGPCESDSDGDGIPDCYDNCPSIWNNDQSDSNLNGLGDLCDPEGPVTVSDLPIYTTSNFNSIAAIDPATGLGTEISPLGADNAGLAFDGNGIIYTIDHQFQDQSSSAAPRQLFAVDLTARTYTPVGNPLTFYDEYGNPLPEPQAGLPAIEIDQAGTIFIGDFEGNFYRLDCSGKAYRLGPGGNSVQGVMDYAIDPNGNLWATSANLLNRLDPATGDVIEAIPLQGVRQYDEIMGLMFDENGTLYATDMGWGLGGGGSTLYTVNQLTGTVTPLGSTGLNPSHGGDVNFPGGAGPACESSPGEGSADQTVLAWGQNFIGQIGDGSNNYRPQSNAFPVITGAVAEVAASMDGSIALMQDGTVQAWGEGATVWPEEVMAFDSLTGGIAPLQDITKIAGGWFHRLALRNDGTIWSWGDNQAGQLGNLSIGGYSQEALFMADSLSGPPFVDIAGGGYHSLGVRQDGTVWAWGDNRFAQLGGLAPPPFPGGAVQVPVPCNVSDVAAGFWYSMALCDDGRVFQWGVQEWVPPFEVNPPPGVNIIDFPTEVPMPPAREIFGGGWHSLAIDLNGQVWAWGENGSGQLGDGSGLSSDFPVPVFLPTAAQAISARCFVSSAVLIDGSVWVWGETPTEFGPNIFPQPQMIYEISNATAVASGMNHMLILTGDTTSGPVNPNPPVLEPLAPRTVEAGQILEILLYAFDPDNDSLSFHVSPLPIGAFFDPISGYFSWQPGADQAGSYTLTFSATDGVHSTSQTVQITVDLSLRSGLVGDYPLDGDATDQSGYGNHGAVNGATPTLDRIGTYSGAMCFDGANDYVRVADSNSQDITGDLSIAAWIQTSDPTEYGKIIFSNMQEISPHAGFSLRTTRYDNRGIDLPGRLHFMAGNQSIFSNSTINTGEWTHVAVTLNGTAARIYINGQLDASGTVGLPLANSVDQAIGSSYSPYYFFAGAIDDLLLYNRALSQSELQQLAGPPPTVGNVPPYLPLIADQEVEVGGVLSFTTSVIDPDCGENPVIMVNNLPAGATFDGQNFSWAPANSDAGTHEITFSATDGHATATETVTITVISSDIDNDGVDNVDDAAPLDPYLCRDLDGDTCDDCSSGSENSSNDGTDSDQDGACDNGDADDDNDGIHDTVDLLPTVFSDELSDGTSFGVITGRGDQFLTVTDSTSLPPNDGIRVTASVNGGLTPATIKPCGGETIMMLSAGDSFSFTCGSVTVETLEGELDIVFVSNSGTSASVSLAAGNGVTFAVSEMALTAAPTNESPILAELNVDGGSQASVWLSSGNGISYQPATDTFSALASNNIPIVLTLDNHEFTINPGGGVRSVAIDIKPGSSQNNINIGSNGVIPVAILSSESFDALTLDPETIRLNAAAVKVAGKSGKYLCHSEDVNADSYPDLVCQVLSDSFVIELGDSTAVLDGKTRSGLSVHGEDYLSIVPDH